MSADLNREFIQDPRAFLAKYPVDIMVGSDLSTPDQNGIMKATAGVRPFSYVNGTDGKVELCLQNEDDSLSAEDALFTLIQAYWLPWESEKAVSLQLGDEASYFFTSALGGCGIYRDDANPPKVSHVAGDTEKSATEQGQAWRDEKAIAAGMNNTRRFSGMRDYGAVGFAAGFIEDDAWVLLGQVIAIDEGSSQWQVASTKVL